MKKQEFINKYGEARYLELQKQQKEWRMNHIQEINEKRRNYRKTHRKIVNAEKRAYYKKHKEHVLTYNSLMRRKYRTVGSSDLTQIENYLSAKADNFNGWIVHHRLETHTSDGVLRLISLTKAELIALGMYRDRTPEELIWMRTSEHSKLHRSSKRGYPLKNLERFDFNQHAPFLVCACEKKRQG